MCLKIALFFISAVWVLFNFHQSKNKGFPSRALPKMSLSSPFVKEFVYTFRNKFEISKDLSFQKQRKQHTKKIKFQRQLQLCVGRLFASPNIYYNNSLNAAVKKQNEPK